MKVSYPTETDTMITYGSTETLSAIATFIYDGDGNRVIKTENGETILYVNKFYEKNLTTGNVTTYYYSGSKMIAEREATTLRYFHQDSLSSTSLMTDASGNSLGTVNYYPFGDSRNSQGNLGTEKLFTGQILDDTGLYYYGARYYDSNIGRFISPDPFVQHPKDPQSLNRYSYVMNNPLKLVDPSGLWWTVSDDCQDIWIDDDTGAITPGYERIIYQAAIDKAQPTLPLVSTMIQNAIQAFNNIVDDLEDKYYNFVQENRETANSNPVGAEMIKVADKVAGFLSDPIISFGIGFAMMDIPLGGMGRMGGMGELSAASMAGKLSGLEKELVAGTGGKIAGFANDAGRLVPHGAERILGRDGGRGVSNAAVIDSVNNGKRIPQADGRTLYLGANAKVVLEPDGRLVTALATHRTGWR